MLADVLSPTVLHELRCYGFGDHVVPGLVACLCGGLYQAIIGVLRVSCVVRGFNTGAVKIYRIGL